MFNAAVEAVEHTYSRWVAHSIPQVALLAVDGSNKCRWSLHSRCTEAGYFDDTS